MKVLQIMGGGRIFSRCAVMILTLLLAWPLQWAPAAAQEPLPRRNLLDMIFGGGRRYIDPPPPVREVAPRRGSANSRSRGAIARRRPAPPPPARQRLPLPPNPIRSQSSRTPVRSSWWATSLPVASETS